MSGETVDCGRRGFLFRALHENLLEPLAETRRQIAETVRLEADERVYESELLAFGPDMLADTAQRSGIATGDADYTRVAKILAQRPRDEESQVSCPEENNWEKRDAAAR